MHSNLKEMIPDVLPHMIGTISFSDDKDVAALQAADLLAWHIRRYSNSMAKDGLAEPRPIADLLWSIPTLTKAWHPNEIEEFVEFYHKATHTVRRIVTEASKGFQGNAGLSCRPPITLEPN